MNDLRFKNASPADPRETPAPVPRRSGPLFKVTAWLLVVIIIAAGAVYGFILYNKKPAADLSSSNYYAVFLQNGEVYFGELAGDSQNELRLRNPYFLQTNGEDPQTVLATSGFVIMKVAKQQHQPVNEMYINKIHVIYREPLRADSQLVESIVKSEF